MMQTNPLRRPFVLLAASTRDAYSYSYYGARNWLACCELLLDRGWHPIEADAILRSCLTRFAADGRENARAKATATDLARLLEAQHDLQATIDTLVENINVPADGRPVKLPSRNALRLVWSR